MLLSACEQRVPKHVSIGGFKKLNIVLETAVRTVGLLQSLLHALQLTLVAALHLLKHRHKHRTGSNLYWFFSHNNSNYTDRTAPPDTWITPLLQRLKNKCAFFATAVEWGLLTHLIFASFELTLLWLGSVELTLQVQRLGLWHFLFGQNPLHTIFHL